MTEENIRFSGVLFFCNLHKHMTVADEVFPAIGVAEKAKLAVVFNALSVAEMIVDVNGKTVFAKDGREFFVSFKMFRHAVRYLNDGFDG